MHVFKRCVFLVILGVAVWASMRAQSDPPPNAEPLQIQEVTFTNVSSLPVSIVDELEQSFTGKAYPENGLDEISNALREKYQEAGFFKVEIGTPKVTDLGGEPLAKASVVIPVVNEGKRYTLGSLTFKNNIHISSSELRAVFPINSGDVFDVSKIRDGLDAARILYGDEGYINFTPVPDTVPHDSAGIIDMTVEVEEGKQFVFGKLGTIAHASKAGIKKINEFWSAHQGQPFCYADIENLVLSLRASGDVSRCADPATNVTDHKDENLATVDIDFDFPSTHMLCGGEE